MSEALVEEPGLKQLHCGHIYHTHCLRAWLQQQQTCPTCARPLAPVAARQQRIEHDNENSRGAADISAERDNAALAPEPESANLEAATLVSMGESGRALEVLQSVKQDVTIAANISKLTYS